MGLQILYLITQFFKRLGETGSLRPKSQYGATKTITAHEQDEILIRVTENSDISIRRLSLVTGICQSSVLRILKREKLHPYHYTPVQNLLPQHLPARLQFAPFLQDLQDVNPHFLDTILFTDEATFTRQEIFNWKNNHLWDSENPHAKRETHFQHEFKVNSWCDVICDYSIAPFELSTNLNGPLYLDFLQEHLHELLEDIPFALRQNMWFLHDGAPPHYPLQVRQRTVSASMDVNPLDFLIWLQMKALVYKEKINSLSELRRKKEEDANVIKNNRQGLFDIKRSLQKRIIKCIEVNGGHFEHLL